MNVCVTIGVLEAGGQLNACHSMGTGQFACLLKRTTAHRQLSPFSPAAAIIAFCFVGRGTLSYGNGI
jgi:hypothetical protein